MGSGCLTACSQWGLASLCCRQTTPNYQWFYPTNVYFLLMLHVQPMWVGRLWLMLALQADGGSITTPDSVISAKWADDRGIASWLSKLLPNMVQISFTHILLIKVNHVATLNMKGGQGVQSYQGPGRRCLKVFRNTANDCHIVSAMFPCSLLPSCK